MFTLWMPPLDKNGVRWYGKWVGNPRGEREDVERCAWEVSRQVGWGFCQCSRKRGFGPNGQLCKQHAKKLEK